MVQDACHQSLITSILHIISVEEKNNYHQHSVIIVIVIVIVVVVIIIIVISSGSMQALAMSFTIIARCMENLSSRAR